MKRAATGSSIALQVGAGVVKRALVLAAAVTALQPLMAYAQGLPTLSAARSFGPHRSDDSHGHRGPELPMPPGVAAIPLGEEISAGGLPSRVQVFASGRSAEAVANWYRKALGPDRVENRLGNAIVLGQGQGHHYLTALVTPVAGGARVTLALSDLSAAADGSGALRESASRWQERLPTGSRLISHTEAQSDAHSSSLHGQRRDSQQLYVNHHGLALNADHLRAQMTQEGWRVDWDERPTASGRVLAFHRAGDQALAVIRQRPEGLTTVLLSQSGPMERGP